MFAALGEEAGFCERVGRLGRQATLAAPTPRRGGPGAVRAGGQAGPRRLRRQVLRRPGGGGGSGRSGRPRRARGRPMIVDAHLDIAWNATSDGRGFLAPPAPGYVISRPALTSAGVGLVCATLYTAPARARRAMRTRFVYENAHEAPIMAVAHAHHYKSCGPHLLPDPRELHT